MVDSVSTFRAVCRGGLNTGADVLSLGEESPGSAIQLLNYEPNLEGGYRRLTGFANNFGTVPGTGSVLGVQVAAGINQGMNMSDEELASFLMTHVSSGLTEDPNVGNEAQQREKEK